MKLEIDAAQPACVTILSPRTQGSYSVKLLLASGRRITLACDQKLPDGAVVKLSWANYVVLAEVLTTLASGDTVLHVRHSLKTEDIEDIRRRWT